MNRRTLVQAVGTGVAVGGVLTSTGTANQEHSVTAEFALPENGGQGMGEFAASASDEWSDPVFLCTFEGGNWYWIDGGDGSSPRDGTFEISAQGAAARDSGGAWAIGPDLRKYDDEGREEFSIPAYGYALTYDEQAKQLWGGSGEGRLWKFASRGEIDQTYDLNESVYGLAHDGETIWAGVVDRGILRVDPTTGGVQSRVTYPDRVFDGDSRVTDLAFADGVLWVLGNDTLFRTNITGDRDGPSEEPTTAELCLTMGGDPVDEADAIPEGLSRQVRLEIRGLEPGFAGADLTLQLPSVVEPTAVEPGNAFSGQAETEIAGQSVRLRVADVDDAITAEESRFVLGTVSVDGVTDGSGRVQIQSQTVDADGGDRVTVSIPAACDELTVTAAQSCPTVAGEATTDPDDDGLCEDLNGNGRTDFDDVTTFFEKLDSEAVQSNAGAFDFNGNGRIDFDDVNALFDEVN